MGADFFIHQRLGEARFVAFVMPEATIAPHVDDDRFLELLTEFGRHARREDDRLRIVAIDVEDRRLDHFRDIGGIGRRARETRIGGEADLVIDDEMQRTAGAMSLEAGEAETFRNHALTRKSRVAMNEQRHNGVSIAVMLILLGAHLAQHHRIDDFEMRRIGGERQMHFVVVKGAIG